MLSGAVEAHFFGEQDILFNRVGARRGKAALGPIALIENEPLIQFPAVQTHVSRPVHGNFAKAEARVCSIRFPAPVKQFEIDVK